MHDELRIEDLLYLMKRQYPVYPSTYSPCHNRCGESARGGGICVWCLYKELAQKVGEDKATDFHAALRSLHQAESAIISDILFPEKA